MYNIDLGQYLDGIGSFREKIKALKQSEDEAKDKMDELSQLRVNKPDPSLIPIDELVNELSSNRYLIRPSYQRQEKINLYKSSAIIESILLDIKLPPIFVYKNPSGTKEIIDGQQRLLSILGFLGKQYLGLDNELHYSKHNNFKLSRLKILKELKGKRFDSLTEKLQDKILDARLSIIEIDASVNEYFNPVDLFIRLNNKPYPIKENSFEMWNSFVDNEIISPIRDLTKNNIDWFYI
ncbi:MAG: DUF262 domain-containing protein [Lentisphaeria bacterium]|nr:DUF262 domain-containing protein [Lentisphaeria bacterium]